MTTHDDDAPRDAERDAVAEAREVRNLLHNFVNHELKIGMMHPAAAHALRMAGDALDYLIKRHEILADERDALRSNLARTEEALVALYVRYSAAPEPPSRETGADGAKGAPGIPE